ncbi:CHASE3 domain-containing protein [Paenibacillus oceani]|uniref:Circadian input-output histidine kinase CikA n=1 Tax=Paenibacillus oceani TaxID=2772510 RepID=A0A927CD44_9BACL|nr:CHASE3 domain-containing protein [Paenibacillus oceani]MBD2865858.1 CHASE3 domain-containing protein [Paenibacillus oceani]
MANRFRFGIRAKIVLGYMVSIICFVVSLIIVDQQMTSMQEERNYVIEHDMAVIDITNRIEKHLLDMQTGQRGYLITGDAAYLEPYTAAKAEWQKDYIRLNQLVSDNPSQQQRLETVKLTIEQWIESAGERAIALKKANDNAGIAEFYRKDPGKVYMNEMRSQFDIFRENQNQLTQERAAALNDRNAALKTALYVMLVMVTVISAAAATLLSGSILRTIHAVTQSIKEISTSVGGMQRRVEVSARDEIGDLGTAMNELLEDQEQKNWTKTKLAEVISMYQGVTDLSSLGHSFIDKITPLLDAVYGVLYVGTGRGEQRKLIRVASYAGEGELAVSPEAIHPGEGLVGQCAKENRMFHLEHVPDDYIRIASGLGSAVPKQVLIAPVEFEGRVTAVLELATLHAFTPVQLQLLDEILDTFGTTIDRVENQMEIERLLRESQAMTEELQSQAEEMQVQAEELQTQQEELRVSNEQLEEQNRFAEEKSRELEKIRIELEEYTEQLEQSSQYKSDFLANMSHELRTPLNSMLILSQLLAENAELGTEERQYAKVIHSSGNDLLTLINDILDLSKVEAGKVEIVPEEMSVTEFPLVMEYQFGKIAEQKGVRFVTRMEPDAPAIFWTDEHRLHQIVKNLLSNAFKFTDSGEVVLSIRRADPAVVADALPECPNETVLAISVADTGVGIPASKRDIIFEAFQQVDGTTSRKYGGTGLGLSICREFANLLGGTILLDSEEGRGSTFTILLPPLGQTKSHESAMMLSEASAAAESAVEAACTEGGEGHIEENRVTSASIHKEIFKNKKVLVVDDDARNRYTLQISLEAAGIEVTVAHNGQECMESLHREAEKFDLILMDIMMPVMDGYTTMRHIREMPEFDAVPIIALTAKAMKYDREKCLEAGASDYISKPLNMNQLFSLMRVWLTKV